MTRTFTTEQLEQARTKALANAERLVSDAALLLKNKRWPAALYFCQIAGEEIGKYLMVLSALVQIKSGYK
jgi:AbiV family abortive infection protein